MLVVRDRLFFWLNLVTPAFSKWTLNVIFHFGFRLANLPHHVNNRWMKVQRLPLTPPRPHIARQEGLLVRVGGENQPQSLPAVSSLR